VDRYTKYIWRFIQTQFEINKIQAAELLYLNEEILYENSCCCSPSGILNEIVPEPEHLVCRWFDWGYFNFAF